MLFQTIFSIYFGVKFRIIPRNFAETFLGKVGNPNDRIFHRLGSGVNFVDQNINQFRQGKKNIVVIFYGGGEVNELPTALCI